MLLEVLAQLNNKSGDINPVSVLHSYLVLERGREVN